MPCASASTGLQPRSNAHRDPATRQSPAPLVLTATACGAAMCSICSHRPSPLQPQEYSSYTACDQVTSRGQKKPTPLAGQPFVVETYLQVNGSQQCRQSADVGEHSVPDGIMLMLRFYPGKYEGSRDLRVAASHTACDILNECTRGVGGEHGTNLPVQNWHGSVMRPGHLNVHSAAPSRPSVSTTRFTPAQSTAHRCGRSRLTAFLASAAVPAPPSLPDAPIPAESSAEGGRIHWGLLVDVSLAACWPLSSASAPCCLIAGIGMQEGRCWLSELLLWLQSAAVELAMLALCCGVPCCAAPYVCRGCCREAVSKAFASETSSDALGEM